MADTGKLTDVVAQLAERDEEFRPFETTKLIYERDEGAEPMWPVSKFKSLLGYSSDEPFDRPINHAKIAASKAGITIKDHFVDGSLFDCDGEVFVSKYAAMLIAMNCNPEKEMVALAQNYFALQVDRQQLEDEKRLKTRFDVAVENRKLTGVAKVAGVQDFKRFNGVGVNALYGGNSVAAIVKRKGLPSSSSHLDYAGSEELAANLFRITQTAAALRRQQAPNEDRACMTHQDVAKGVRQAIRAAGNTLPENLPPAQLNIDRLATQKRKQLAQNA